MRLQFHFHTYLRPILRWEMSVKNKKNIPEITLFDIYHPTRLSVRIFSTYFCLTSKFQQMRVVLKEKCFSTNKSKCFWYFLFTVLTSTLWNGVNFRNSSCINAPFLNAEWFISLSIPVQI